MFTFGNYYMIVVKHDETNNAQCFDLGCEAWVVLIGFPEELKSASVMFKVVLGFGNLVHCMRLKILLELLLRFT
jgi:hypothetical protein